MKLAFASVFAVVALFVLLYVVRAPLHDFLFPEEAAMYAERVKIAETLSSF